MINPAAKMLFEHLRLDPKCVETGCQSLLLQQRLDEAISFIGTLGEELVNAGMPGGDRTVILANIRQLIQKASA